LTHRFTAPLRLSIEAYVHAIDATWLDAGRMAVGPPDRGDVLQLLSRDATTLRFRGGDGIEAEAHGARDGNALWVQHAGQELKIEDRTLRPARRAPADDHV